MNDWIAEAGMWVDERLPGSEPWQHALKVNEEAGELARCELGRGDAAEEAADVIIATLAYCARTGIDIDLAVTHKFRQLWERS